MRILKWVGLGLLVVLLLLAGGIYFLVTSPFIKNQIVERSSAAAGREVAIDGDVEIDWSLTPRIRINKLRVANTEWGRRPDMVSIDRAEVSIKLLDLLRGRVTLPEVRLIRPKVLLEKNADGTANWTFGENPAAATAVEATAPDERQEFPVIGKLVIDDGTLDYHDPTQEIEISSKVNTAVGTAGGAEQTTLRGNGRFAGEPFTLEVTAGALLALRETDKPYPVSVNAAVGQTKLTVDGTLQDPLKMSGPNLEMDLRGQDLADLFPLFGIPIPPTPVYALSGKLTHEGDVWAFKGFSGTVGDSDLSGDFSLDVGGERPVARATLVSQKLDFDDLAGFIGAPPDDKAEEEDDGRVLPDQPVNLERLRAMDMEVSFSGEEVLAPGLPLDDLQTKLNLEDGRLVLDPLSFGIASGTVDGRLILNGRQAVSSVRADLRISQLNLQEFFKESEFANDMGGTFGGHIDLTGEGNSFAEILGSSDGSLAIVMGGGKFSNLLLEVAGIDVAEALGFVLTEDQPVAARCVVADFHVRDGLMRTKTAVIDTTDTNITVEGAIDLGTEAMELGMEAHPKDPSLLSARSPVNITGTFASPEFGVDPGPLVARGAAAAALGVLLTPLAALLPMVELGLGEDSPCYQLIHQAQESKG
ncbi:AsmA family protein [Rhodospirillaceae bacterium SYSU D60014]|uniref:AsmA family protein n=1 Tax=Virgifigura deserti TaxID=2268457 RepID=UPI000E67468B